jgi:glutathione S-transferase
MAMKPVPAASAPTQLAPHSSSLERSLNMHLVLCEVAVADASELTSYSPYTLKVHAALRVLGFPYERRFGLPRDFRALNPRQQVPVLLVDGKPIIDSTSIIRFLFEHAAEQNGTTPWPIAHETWLWEDYADRALSGFLVAARWADVDNWPLVADAYFGAAPWLVRKLIAPKIRSTVLASLVARDVTRGGLDNCWSEYAALLLALDARAPETGYWMGDELSPADCALYGHVGGLRSRLTAAQHAMIAKHPRLTAYLNRIHQRVHHAHV